MNMLGLVWGMMAGACLLVTAVHGLVWLRRRSARAHLLYAVSALGTAVLAWTELWMMRAWTPEQFGLALQWLHLPVWVVVVSLVGFVRVYLQAGRAWLGWTVIGLRTASLGLNFLFTPNLNFREITALRPVNFLGETVATGVGTPNPWMLVGQLSLVLLVVFVADGAWAVWRRGDRRQALVLGGSVVLFTVAGLAQAVLFLWGILVAPLTPSVFYLGILGAMGFEMSRDLLRSAELTETLRLREADLRRERALTDAVFDSVPGLLYLYRSDGTLVRWNRQHETQTGFGAVELAVRRADDWFEPEDRTAMRAAWGRVFSGDSISVELPLRRKDGTRVPYLLTGVRVVIDGQPHLVGIGIDITARRASEAEAARHRAELAHLARVAALGELSGSIAHELNQPLAIILSNAQAAQRLLAQDPPNLPEVRDILADIVSADRRAGDVIKRLRALLQRGESERQPVCPNALARSVLALLGGDLAGRGIAVEADLEAGLPLVLGDRIPLEQAILNLVTNACDAMADTPAGARCLGVRTRREAGGVRVSVSDRGCGLPADGGRLFDAFYTTKPHGLGLGLSICRTIVTAHGGRVWAEANPAPAGGATFHVTLPAPEAAP
ncbi:MAG: hypothetical protein RJA22_2416 [Verrucomicrobiota bacterium]|jgi:PAS domain S-box-containing protein